MTAREILVRAGEIARRDHTAGHLAVTHDGTVVAPIDPSAARWSSVGALCKVAYNGDETRWAPITQAGHDAEGFLYAAASERGYWSVVAADAAGASAVAAVFRRAVALAETAERDTPRSGARAGHGNHPKGEAA